VNAKFSSALVSLALMVALGTPVHQAICGDQKESAETCHPECASGNVKSCCPSVVCQPEQYLAGPRLEAADASLITVPDFPAVVSSVVIPSLFRSAVIQQAVSPPRRAALCTFVI
jgi:hypothetical protein